MTIGVEVRHATPAEVIEHDRRLLGEGRAAVAVTVLAGEALTLGVSQPEGSPSAVRARELGVSVLRRSTGGTAVLSAAGDLAWSLVLPRSDHRVGRTYVRDYARFGRALCDELAARGTPAAWRPAPGLVEELCVLSSRGHVLRAADRIVGGAAQHLTRDALLHHGFLARGVDRERAARIFAAPLELLARELGGWTDLGIVASPDEMARSLLARLRADLGPTG